MASAAPERLAAGGWDSARAWRIVTREADARPAPAGLRGLDAELARFGTCEAQPPRLAKLLEA